MVHLLDDCILGLVSPDPGGSFFRQSRIQVGDIFADGVGCFHDGPILYGRISLAHILVRSLFFQIFLHIGNPGVQFLIAGFTSNHFRIQVILQFIRGFVDCIGFVRNPFIQFIVFSFTSRSFVINIGLQLIRGFVDRIGFVGNPFIQFVVSCFTACHFVVVGSSQRCNAIGCVLVHLLDDCILGLVSPDPGCCFLCQGGVQVGHVFADGVGCFHDGPILYGGVVLAYIGIRCLVFQIFFHIGNPGVQSAQVLAHGISRLNRDPFSGCSIYDTIGSGDSARGNSITFDSSFIINSLRATFIMVGKSSSSIFCGCYLRIIRKIIS